MNVAVASPHSIVSIQVCVGDVWVGHCISVFLMFMWLRRKIRAGKSDRGCGKLSGAVFYFLTTCGLTNLYVCVCVCVCAVDR